MTGEVFEVAKVRAAAARYGALTTFLYDFDRGIITISLQEYNRLPAILLDALTLFRQTKAQMEEARMKEAMP